MATSSDKEHADEKDDAGADEGAEEPKKERPAAKASGASAKSAPASKAPVDAEDDDDDDDDDDEEDDEDEAPPAAKAAPAKSTSSKAKDAGKSAGASKEKAAKKPRADKSDTEEAPAKARPVAPRPVSARNQGALGKSLVLFVIVVGVLALGFALLGREGGTDATPAPKWNVGQTVDVEVTLVPSDSKDLACASADEIGGKHCQYEAQNKPWSKGDTTDDKTLKPYTTTDRIQFLAAGLWDQPALKGKLPNTRFSVKCKYKVEGKLKKPFIRWAADGQWFERADDWYAGAVTDCQLVGP